MNSLLTLAVISMTLALIFYSIGVWGEKITNQLTWANILFFVLGFICDSTGTHLMTYFVHGPETIKLQLHMITGALALFFMLVHLLWAVHVRAFGTEQSQQNFHKFSLVVWSFWLIPYVLGMFMGMLS